MSEKPEITLSRHFDAAPAVVYRAWGSASSIRRWFCPRGYTVPEATVDMRVGGRFDYCMRSPESVDHWVRGRYTELVPEQRIGLEMSVFGSNEVLLFVAHTTLTFAADQGGTLLTVRQRYDIRVPEIAGMMVQGASEGWKQTLDKLEESLADGSVVLPPAHAVHDSFRIERQLAASPERVWAALTQVDAKSRWFGGSPSEWEVLERTMDVRPGGRERQRGRWTTGRITCFDAVYFDVVPNQRLIYTYDLYINDQKISVSLATFELYPHAGGTRMVFSEQGVFIDGYEDGGARERGSAMLMDKLAASLA